MLIMRSPEIGICKKKFLLELGKGYAFVDRQQHIATDAGDFYIDLVNSLNDWRLTSVNI